MEIVIVFGLSIKSILYKPTCSYNSDLHILNCSQNSWEVSNLSKIFEFTIILNIIFLTADSLMKQYSSEHTKTYVKEQLSVSIKFRHMKHLCHILCYMLFNIYVIFLLLSNQKIKCISNIIYKTFYWNFRKHKHFSMHKSCCNFDCWIFLYNNRFYTFWIYFIKINNVLTFSFL